MPRRKVPASGFAVPCVTGVCRTEVEAADNGVVAGYSVSANDGVGANPASQHVGAAVADDDVVTHSAVSVLDIGRHVVALALLAVVGRAFQAEVQHCAWTELTCAVVRGV